MGTRLRNKVAIVTGGGTGIGEAICKKFAQEGAKVVVCGLPDDPVQQVASQIEEYGGVAIPYTGDISQPINAKSCVQLAVDTYGKLDILVNNAGVFPTVGYINEYPIDAFEYLLQNNIQSAFMMTKFAIPFLQKAKGCIVNAGSEAGIDGDAQNAPYAGTKGFMHAFTRSIAAEQAQFGVRANVVCPGPIDTSWTHHEIGPMTTKMEKQFISATPMGRRGTPEEVANVYLFLASAESSYVTGALYTVDGGITISKGPSGLMADSAMKKAPEGELALNYSREGDPVRRPFTPARNEFSETEGGSQSPASGNMLRNTLVGLSLAAVAFNVATKYWGKKSDKRANQPLNQDTPQANQEPASPSNENQPQNVTQPTAETSNQGTASDDISSRNQPEPGAAKTGRGKAQPRTPDPKGGLDQGFTNEAATGNND